MNAFLRKTLMLVAMGGLMAAAGACGSSSPKGGAGGNSGAGGTPGGGGISRFTGTWHPSSGTITFLCSGETDTQPVDENVTWAAGVGADLVQTSGNCVLKANVTGGTASALPSQTCTQMDGAITVTIALSAYTFSLGADGLTATESASGTATLVLAGQSSVCSYSESAIYTKITS